MRTGEEAGVGDGQPACGATGVDAQTGVRNGGACGIDRGAATVACVTGGPR